MRRFSLVRPSGWPRAWPEKPSTAALPEAERISLRPFFLFRAASSPAVPSSAASSSVLFRDGDGRSSDRKHAVMSFSIGRQS